MSAPRRAGTLVAHRYRIEQPIGEGGHGVVYRAIDVNVGRPIALKLLHTGMPGAHNLEARFEQEARLARALQHPNTVRLLDFGRDADGALYIAYELLEGTPMDAAIDTHGPMDAARVARIGSQVLKSLMEAHQHGVVHRDIKPSNIFLCDFSGERDFVKVLDFGIAKGAGPASALTQTGFVVGTPSYMAPEQVRGDAVGPATDVYALGLVMAEALAGGIIVTGTTDAVIAAAQLSPDPVVLPPPVLQSPLGAVIHRATQKPLERRYSAATQMLDDLSALGLGPSSTPMSQAERVSLALAPTGLIASAPSFATAPTGIVGQPTPAAYPMMMTPVHAPVAPKKSSGGGLVVGILALCGLAAILMVAGLMFAMSGSARERDSSDDSGTSTSTKKKRKKSSAPDDDAKETPPKPSGPLAELDGALIESRLRANGWQVKTRSELDGRLDFIVMRSPAFGTVALATSRLQASLIETATPRPGKAFEREGDRALEVVIVAAKDDPQQLLDQLLGRSTPTAPAPSDAEPAPPEPVEPAPAPAAPVPAPVPTPRVTPPPPTPNPAPPPSNPCNCSKGDLMCAMRCSQKR